MHQFWYHSPVRFYRTLGELQDMTNPQNTQYFGEKNPFQLEVNELHRYLIPNVNNEVPIDEYYVWCGDTKLISVCEIYGGKLKYVTFKSKKEISGRLEIKNDLGETIFYSNCVQFVDSTDADGRKFIKIATKHLYNRKLFDFGSPYNWIVTTLPAYCLGMIGLDAEISNSRTGGNNSLKVRETYLDEIVEYQFLAGGDGNLLNFIQAHVTNNQFYIDGTQRTSLDKMDRDEFNMFGKLRFTNVKDKDGLNVTIDLETIFENIYTWVLADDYKTIISDSENSIIKIN